MWIGILGLCHDVSYKSKNSFGGISVGAKIGLVYRDKIGKVQLGLEGAKRAPPGAKMTF